MKLKKLLTEIKVAQVQGSKEIEISGICSDSRRVAPGNLFIAKKGLSTDGTEYIPAAMSAGAIAIATDLYDPSLKGVTQLIDPDMGQLEAGLAAAFYGHPSKELFVAGVTGTNGKTSVAYLVRHLLEPCGLMSTIEQIIGTFHYAASLTTLDVTTNHKLLREMVLQGCTSAVMEVSSHGMEQGRACNIAFDVAVFTNLSLDHLDYHQTMEAYGLAKAKLFEQAEKAVVNIDDSFSKTILEHSQGPVLTYGQNGDLQAKNVIFDEHGSTFTLCYKGEEAAVSLPLVGSFQVSNAIAATGVALLAGKSLSEIAERLKTVPPISGRLERVENKAGKQVYVDFAHTPEALRQSIESLRALSDGKLVTVFGCGGNRDPSKRPEMGAIASELSDSVVITSDNPRSEDPGTICQQIAAGVKGEHTIVLDRRDAIGEALKLAGPNDLVLIAGKGHETYQEFAHRRVDFDDRKVTQELCENT